jgi:hypothetical protein
MDAPTRVAVALLNGFALGAEQVGIVKGAVTFSEQLHQSPGLPEGVTFQFGPRALEFLLRDTGRNLAGYRSDPQA